MSRMLLGSVAAVIGLAMLSSASEAASRKPPVNEDCLEWAKYRIVGNWVNAPNGDYWVCVRGPTSGAKIAISGPLAGASGGGVPGGGDDDDDDGGGDTKKPGWRLGTGDDGLPPGQDKKGNTEGPPGQNK